MISYEGESTSPRQSEGSKGLLPASQGGQGKDYAFIDHETRRSPGRGGRSLGGTTLDRSDGL